VALRVKKVWRREVAIFGKTAKNFGRERLWVLKVSNLPKISPKIEDYQRQNSPKSAKVARKLRSATSQFSGGTSLKANISQTVHPIYSMFGSRVFGVGGSKSSNGG